MVDKTEVLKRGGIGLYEARVRGLVGVLFCLSAPYFPPSLPLCLLAFGGGSGQRERPDVLGDLDAVFAEGTNSEQREQSLSSHARVRYRSRCRVKSANERCPRPVVLLMPSKAVSESASQAAQP